MKGSPLNLVWSHSLFNIMPKSSTPRWACPKCGTATDFSEYFCKNCQWCKTVSYQQRCCHECEKWHATWGVPYTKCPHCFHDNDPSVVQNNLQKKCLECKKWNDAMGTGAIKSCMYCRKDF
jgi:hypothetical protein